jgi:hypothetical protein
MYDRNLAIPYRIDTRSEACLRAGKLGRAPAQKKMLKMQIAPNMLLKKKGEKNRKSSAPKISMKTKGLT